MLEEGKRASFIVRDAKESDFPAITDIFNEVLRTSMSIYMEQEVTIENRLQLYHDRLAAGFPFIVAIDRNATSEDGEVIGYATYGTFRASYGYRFSVEHSIHIRKDQRGKGLGNYLLTKLLDIAKEKGIHVMVAGIDSSNEISIKMHEKFGFVEVARMPEVGKKHDQWLTLVLMQKILS